MQRCVGERHGLHSYNDILLLQQVHAIHKRQKTSINYFNGLATTILSAIPSNAVFFVVYNSLLYWSQCQLSTPLGGASSATVLLERLTASAVASLPQNAIKIPAELVKQRAQLSQSTDILGIVREAVRDRGVRGLYVGGNGMVNALYPCGQRWSDS